MKRTLGAMVMGCVALSAGCSAQPAAQRPSDVQKLTAGPSSAGNGSDPIVSTATSSTPTPASSSDDRIVARINGQPVTMGELLKPLLEAHGLQILNALMQLDLLKQEARAEHYAVTPQDIRHERELTLGRLFKDADAKEQDQLDDADRKGDKAAVAKLQAQIDSDRQVLLTEYLDNQHFSRAEFELRMEINAYERKKAERLLTGKITDAMVENEFNVEFGETADIRYVELANMQEVAEVRQRLKTESFADVARLSHDTRTKDSGGLMPGISRQTPGLPQTFKDMAFALQPGQVSETLSLNGFYFILKLEKKYPPKAVKFDNVKDSLRKSMFDRLVQSLMGQIGSGVAGDVVTKLQIEDPVLKKQFDELAARQQAEATDRKVMDAKMKQERAAHALMSLPPTTGPATTGPATTGPATTEPAAAGPVATEPAPANPAAPATQAAPAAHP